MGAAVEILASRASADGHLRYPIFLPNVPKANMNFDQIKGSYLNLLERLRKNSETSIDIPDFCASLQVCEEPRRDFEIVFDAFSKKKKTYSKMQFSIRKKSLNYTETTKKIKKLKPIKN